MKILDCGVAVLDGDTHASKWIEEQGKIDYDPAIAKVIEPLLNPGDVAIDVGAMIGAYSYGMKRSVGGTGRVIAFEPYEPSMECLSFNCPDVERFRMALGRDEGFGESVPSVKYPDNVGARTFSMEGDSVQVKTLDEFWSGRFGGDRVDLLKIDVEGMEPDVIAGALETIGLYRPLIFIEINHDCLEQHGYKWHHVIDPLTRMGYTVKWLGEGHSFQADKWPQLDVLMVP